MYKKHRLQFLFLSLLFLVAGCATTKVSDYTVVPREKLPRPNCIWIHDFAATSAEINPDSMLAELFTTDNTTQTPQQIKAGRELGSQITKDLIDKINAMGLQAKHIEEDTIPLINDLVIRGYLVSVDEGAGTKRIGVGFGSGSSELKAALEGFRMTQQGLRQLVVFSTVAKGGKPPGAATGVVTMLATANPVGLIVNTGIKAYGEASGSATIKGRAKQTASEIARQLKKAFQKQEWIE